MTDPLAHLPSFLKRERGIPNVGVAIWRPGSEPTYIQTTVGEFFSKPENQSGTWLIDGGWGGPPGPVYVEWNEREGFWQYRGFWARRPKEK